MDKAKAKGTTMRNGIHMRDEFVEEVILTFGTANAFAAKTNLSKATISGILSGKAVGERARIACLDAINGKRQEMGRPAVGQLEVFYLGRLGQRREDEPPPKTMGLLGTKVVP